MHEELTAPNERLMPTHHPKISRIENQPVVDANELIAKIEELALHPPRSREELAAQIHALARIDLRDTAGDDVITESDVSRRTTLPEGTRHGAGSS
jgi:hypothetical protein